MGSGAVTIFVRSGACCGGSLKRDPTHTVASNNIDAANATRGDGVSHAHQLCFTGSAATRARTRASNAGDGSIIGNSSSRPDTARNSSPRSRHVAHVSRCVSPSRASLAFSRPSTYPRILLSIRSQLITTFFQSQFPFTELRSDQTHQPTNLFPTSLLRRSTRH